MEPGNLFLISTVLVIGDMLKPGHGLTFLSLRYGQGASARLLRLHHANAFREGKTRRRHQENTASTAHYARPSRHYENGEHLAK